MSLLQNNDVILSENCWEDIVNNYKLHRELEVVIKERDLNSSQLPSGSAPAATTKQSAWAYRAFLLIGAFTLLGNLPIQSRSPNTPVSNNQTPKLMPKHDFLSSKLLASKSIVTNITPKLIDHDHRTNYKNSIDSTTNEISLEENDSSLRLPLPLHSIETYTSEALEKNNTKWTTYHVRSYDNLTNIFHKLGHQDALKILKSDKSIFNELETINKNGAIARASSNKDGKLSELVFTHDNISSYVITLNNNKYTGAWKKGVFETRQARSSFTIKNGLFFDGRKAGIKNNIIQKIVKVFDWDIDFSHDIRVGDKVTAVFEEIYHDGDKVGSKNLLAAEFINKKRVLRTVRYTFKDGKSDYFTPDGREMKKAFIRTPIVHARISSHFNPGRIHPVLHKIRAHKGTDFAARRGTPIMATGNASITYIGVKGGYGRMIILKHREGYSTRYGHMSNYKNGLKVGDKVYQGDIIGYVGSSGLATGPHCHYELRKNGKPIDPMRAHLPNSMSLAKDELQDFRNKAINLVLQLNVLHRFVEANIQIDSAIGG